MVSAASLFVSAWRGCSAQGKSRTVVPQGTGARLAIRPVFQGQHYKRVPQAGGQLRVEEVPPDLIAVHRRQEGVHLLLCENLFWLIAGLGHHGPVGGIPGDHMGRLRILQTLVEHGVDAEHHGVRQFVPVLRVAVDTALVFQLSVQLLDVHAGHPGDDLIPQVGLDVAPDELLITPQGVGPQGSRTVVLHPPAQPLARVMRLSSVSSIS